MKILILALSGIGDALMFTPALKLMRRVFPDAKIDALVMFKGTKELFTGNPDLDNIIYFDFLNSGVLKSLNFVLRLRKKYDVSINVYPSNRKEYNIINFIIGAKKRAGIKYLLMNNRNLGWLNNITVAENEKTHNVKTNINLIEKLTNNSFQDEPAMQVTLSENDLSFAERYLKQVKIEEKDFVVGFHPGCATLKNHIKRRWEPEKFSNLATKLIKEKNARILIFGGPEEEDLKTKVCSSVSSERCTAVTVNSFKESIAVMKRCNLFVTNDSALMHVASAIGLKIIAIIGPTNKFFIHPWKTEYKIASLNLDCSPCFFYSPRPLLCSRRDVEFKCIKDLSVEKVYHEILSFL